MKIIPLPLLFLAALLPVAAFGGGTAARKAAVCGARTSCAIAKRYRAGTSRAGRALDIFEVRLGLADKPADAPPDGCRSEGGHDGGVEYWLAEGTAPPKRILKLCNDGYGAADIGDDTGSFTRRSAARLGGGKAK